MPVREEADLREGGNGILTENPRPAARAGPAGNAVPTGNAGLVENVCPA